MSKMTSFRLEDYNVKLREVYMKKFPGMSMSKVFNEAIYMYLVACLSDPATPLLDPDWLPKKKTSLRG